MSSEEKSVLLGMLIIFMSITAWIVDYTVSQHVHSERRADQFKLCMTTNHPPIECRTAVYGDDGDSK